MPRRSAFAGLTSGLTTIGRLFAASRENGVIWLAPLLALLVVLGLLLAALGHAGPLAPFLYPLL